MGTVIPLRSTVSVTGYKRSLPRDPYAEAKAEMNNRLFNDAHGEMLERAILLMDLSDIQRARIEESF